MSKPHEQTWRLERKEIANPQHLNQIVMGPEGLVGAFLFKSDADLAIAAPAMARMLRKLLATLEASSHAEACPVMDDADEEDPPKQWLCLKESEPELRALLMSAGVPLP